MQPVCDDEDRHRVEVKRLKKRLNNVLSVVAKFFTKSIKRWAGLKWVAKRMGYGHQRPLLKFH